MNMHFSQVTGFVGVSLCICCRHIVFFVHVDTHLICLGAGETARQWSTVGRQSGGERWAAVCQNRFKVTGKLLRKIT